MNQKEKRHLERSKAWVMSSSQKVCLWSEDVRGWLKSGQWRQPSMRNGLVALSITVIFVFAGMGAMQAKAGVYNMELAGKHLAYVKSEHSVEAAIDLAKHEVEAKTGKKVIRPVEALVLNKSSQEAKPLPLHDLAKKLESEVEWMVPVWEVYGLGGVKIPLGSKSEAEAVLAAIREQGESRTYADIPADGTVPKPAMDTPNAELANLNMTEEALPALAATHFDVKKRGLQEEVGIVSGEAPQSQVLNKDAALEKIAAGRPVHHVHQVKLGDDLESISKQWNTTPQAVQNLNPSLDWGFVRPKTGVHVERQEPLIGDQVVLTETAQLYTPFEVVYEDDPEMVTGQYKVKSKGRPGVKTVTSTVTQVGGYEISRKVDKETYDMAPTAAIIFRGTGDPKALSGKVDWPLHGPITSPFGERTWEDHTQEFHRGIDIGAPTGTPVAAAKAGKVIFAGEMGTYGNVVFIDHGNGLSTRYAHLSVIDVAVGDELQRGEKLGEVGSTGFSTGPHLHFEVLIDEEPKNPMLFLEGRG